jgi:hypothetical protein
MDNIAATYKIVVLGEGKAFLTPFQQELAKLLSLLDSA